MIVTLSEAEAVTATVPPTVAPCAGAVMSTVSGPDVVRGKCESEVTAGGLIVSKRPSTSLEMVGRGSRQPYEITEWL